MTSLTVDLSSLPDLLEGFEADPGGDPPRIRQRISRWFDGGVRGRTVGSDSGQRANGPGRLLARASRRQEYFTLNETFDALRAAGLSCDLLADLTAVELELGGRLVSEHWVQEHLTGCCWVHHEVRERLQCLMVQPRVALPAS